MSATRENVECNNSVIVAAPFTQEFHDGAWLSRTKAESAALHVATTLVWVHCDADTMHTYLRHRGAARDSAKLAAWDEYLAGIDLALRPPEPYVLIDNSRSSSPLQPRAEALIKSLIAEQQ